jgi:hypothetical protein
MHACMSVSIFMIIVKEWGQEHVSSFSSLMIGYTDMHHQQTVVLPSNGQSNLLYKNFEECAIATCKEIYIKIAPNDNLFQGQ